MSSPKEPRFRGASGGPLFKPFALGDPEPGRCLFARFHQEVSFQGRCGAEPLPRVIPLVPLPGRMDQVTALLEFGEGKQDPQAPPGGDHPRPPEKRFPRQAQGGRLWRGLDRFGFCFRDDEQPEPLPVLPHERRGPQERNRRKGLPQELPFRVCPFAPGVTILRAGGGCEVNKNDADREQCRRGESPRISSQAISPFCRQVPIIVPGGFPVSGVLAVGSLRMRVVPPTFFSFLSVAEQKVALYTF